MSTANPLTASSAIQRALVPKQEEINKENSLKPDLGVYAKDIVEISTLGLEKQQKETQMLASKSNAVIANEVISISSTLGKRQNSSYLTQTQATNLYNKVSALL